MSAFEWLNDIPDEWEPPEELLEPTGDIVANLAIKMLRCEFLGHRVRILLGQFIAEQSLFTVWFLSERKHGAGAKEAVELTLVPSEQVRVVYEAWQRFDGVPTTADTREELTKLGDRRAEARTELENALRTAIDALRHVQGRDE
jgi:hypothetical protein